MLKNFKLGDYASNGEEERGEKEMRKRLAVLLAMIMLLALMGAGPTAAQVEPVPTVTVCITLGPGEIVIIEFDGERLEFEGPGSFEAEVPEVIASILIDVGLATRGPCPDGGDGGGGGGGAPLEVTQETEQEAESGDIDQSFEVTSTGDNSNQCAGVQGVTNTGNPQNVVDLLQYASEADDFEFEEVGSGITASPETATTCDQQVNQAASASG
jgi:hypothetical protein